MVLRLSMSRKEILEAQKVGIPSEIIERMRVGLELSEREKQVVRNFGKVYVAGYVKGAVRVRPQLRNYSGSRINKYEVWVIFSGFRFDKHYIEAKDMASARKKAKNKYKKKFQKDVRISSIRPMGRAE